MHRPIGVKFFTVIRLNLNFIMQVQNFGGLIQKILGVKNMQNFACFWTTLNLVANISRTDEDIHNRTSTQSTVILPMLGGKSPVNFGPLTK